MPFEQSNQAFISAAYAITWIVMIGYLVHLGRRSARAATAHERVVNRGEEL